VQRDVKEVMAEVLRKLTGRAALDAGVVSGNGKKDGRGNTYGPNRDRLTVGVDLETAGVSTAFLVWREKRWPKDSCGQRRKM